MIVNGLFVAPILTYIMPAYYGRYSGNSWFSISAKLSWLVQECPAFFVPLYYLLTTPALELPNQLLLAMMILHYFQRSFIYALLQRSKNNVAISITFFAFIFCLYNGFMQVL
jgi:3-oxo-5-alpha-steroid 4-dehydrogenase 1